MTLLLTATCILNQQQDQFLPKIVDRDRQTDRQTQRQTDTDTDRHRQTKTKTERHTGGGGGEQHRGDTNRDKKEISE